VRSRLGRAREALRVLMGIDQEVPKSANRVARRHVAVEDRIAA